MFIFILKSEQFYVSSASTSLTDIIAIMFSFRISSSGFRIFIYMCFRLRAQYWLQLLGISQHKSGLKTVLFQIDLCEKQFKSSKQLELRSHLKTDNKAVMSPCFCLAVWQLYKFSVQNIFCNWLQYMHRNSTFIFYFEF